MTRCVHGEREEVGAEVKADYDEFIASKAMVAQKSGFAASTIHPMLYDFQADIVRWALKLGRAAVFADCGLGKSFIQLDWARQVSRSGPVLIVAPLAVARQTIGEGRKLNIDVRYVKGPTEIGRFDICITNYERVESFVGTPLAGIVCDESSILKSIDGAIRGLLLTEFTGIPYRLCCTATPCPNDIAELANHAAFLGVMKRNEMLASFFVHDEDGWRLRGHAAKPFYRWLASWSMALKSPSDLGYDGSRFVLPELKILDEIVVTDWRKPGELFAGQLKGITDRADVRKRSVPDRVKRAAEIAAGTSGPVLIWCGLNTEADAVTAVISGAVNVQGSDDPEVKADIFERFVKGEIRVVVTKGKIGGFGMNFQNCPTMIFLGMSDSYELYYQCIRRCWRYGQKHPVKAYVIVTDHEFEIVENVRRKEQEADILSREIIAGAREYEMEELGKVRHTEVIERAEFTGENFRLIQDDCVVAMRELPVESIDMSVYSPPFLSLYQYSASNADMGNSKDPRQFFEHFGFMVRELLRMTKPGRITCVHVAQVPTTLVNHGVIGIQDFRGQTILSYQNAGWIYHGEVCIDKDPQAQAIRTKAKALMFSQLKKDASWLRPALADYILVFRKPGENAVAIHPDITNEDWIKWARPIWYGMRESDTLNKAEARSEEDDRHICALQLGTIERCIRLWSNPGETIFSPFAGIGSEGYVAVKLGRRFIGCELKPLYARTAAKNLTEVSRDCATRLSQEVLTFD